jgi:predicted nucleotidyltransferase
MRPHHERTIQRLAEHFSKQEECLAVIVGGSIAKGLEREDSDVDVMLVVTDEAYRERWERNELFYITAEFCDYPGGYVDGKIVNLGYIAAAAERGNEITRAAFKGAFVVHSKIDGMEEIVKKIPEYQVHEKREKIQSFYAQFECAYWYLGEAIRWNDRYLLNHAVSQLILYGGRLILAHNEILYPYHKFLMTELRRAPEKPENLMQLIEALLEEPNAENARAFYDAIKGFRFWNEAWEAWQTRYLKDTELAWLDNRAFIGDI